MERDLLKEFAAFSRRSRGEVRPGQATEARGWQYSCEVRTSSRRPSAEDNAVGKRLRWLMDSASHRSEMTCRVSQHVVARLLHRTLNIDRERFSPAKIRFFGHGDVAQ